ncbi:hypothetical protein OKW21_002422 [Catalinimonas alkaloidigena]|nr:hypothetical protein [Catalinimonas alkaloidigena]
MTTALILILGRGIQVEKKSSICHQSGIGNKPCRYLIRQAQ